ncbi:MAG: hypothetical protein FJY21_11060 [Bacteroidetes bacterium]|nr:hypothetical protein [Bacteroidota bacterium]
MKANDYLYPHPILKLDDDNDFNFKPDVSRKIAHQENSATISFEYELTNLGADLLDLLRKDKIQLVCEVNCSYTIYRKVFFSNRTKLSFEISDEDLKNKVDLQLLLIAVEELSDFTSSNFSPDLLGQTFQIEAGDVMGILDTHSIDVDALRLGVSDFIKIIENTTDEFTRYELNKNAVFIKVPKSDLDKFQRLNNSPNFGHMLISILVAPALTHALHHLNEENEEAYGEKAWFRALKEQCDSLLGLEFPEPSDIPVLVDKILQKPNSRVVQELEALTK